MEKSILVAALILAGCGPGPQKNDPCVCAEVGIVYQPARDGATHRLDCIRWERLESDKACRGQGL